MTDYLNLGCGSTYHPDWTNVDLNGGEGIVQHDLYNGIPFEDQSFDAVYTSDLIEHLHKRYVPTFLAECYRVLRPEGLIRVAAPDLEAVTRVYLNNLYEAAKGSAEAQARYEWTTIELLDQLCRHRSGGEMADYWKRNPMPCETFVFDRVGKEGESAVKSYRKGNHQPTADATAIALDTDPVAVGQFRTSGQAHLWMYDRYSLERLLKEAGFTGIRQCVAEWSRIDNFGQYRLDIAPDGSVRKPDSFYMEGEK